MKSGPEKNVVVGNNIRVPFNLPDDTDMFIVGDGFWNPSVLLPQMSSANSNLRTRRGTTLLITVTSTWPLTVTKTGTDLLNDMVLNSGEYDLFMFDGVLWRKIAGK